MSINVSEARVRETLQLAGISVQYINNEHPGSQGYPDFKCTYEGEEFWVEVKAPDDEKQIKFQHDFEKLLDKYRLKMGARGRYFWTLRYNEGLDMLRIDSLIKKTIQQDVKNSPIAEGANVHIIMPRTPSRKIVIEKFEIFDLDGNENIFLMAMNKDGKYVCPSDSSLFGKFSDVNLDRFSKYTENASDDYIFILSYSAHEALESYVILETLVKVTAEKRIRNSIDKANDQIKMANKNKSLPLAGIFWLDSSNCMLEQDTIDAVIKGDLKAIFTENPDGYDVCRKNALKGFRAISLFCFETDDSIFLYQNRNSSVQIRNNLFDALSSIKTKNLIIMP